MAIHLHMILKFKGFSFSNKLCDELHVFLSSIYPWTRTQLSTCCRSTKTELNTGCQPTIYRTAPVIDQPCIPRPTTIVDEPGPSSIPNVQDQNERIDDWSSDRDRYDDDDDDDDEQRTNGSEDNADAIEDEDADDEDCVEESDRVASYDYYGWIYPDFFDYEDPNDVPMNQNDNGNPEKVGIDDGLYEGAIFSNKNELAAKVDFYQVKHRFEYRVLRSSKTRYFVVCKHKGCPFMLRATAIKRGGWRVVSFNDDHFCQRLMSLYGNNYPTLQLPSRINPKEVMKGLFNLRQADQPN